MDGRNLSITLLSPANSPLIPLNTRNRRDLRVPQGGQVLTPSTQITANDATIADVLAIVKGTHDAHAQEGAARMRDRGSDAIRAKLGPLAGQSGKRGARLAATEPWASAWKTRRARGEPSMKRRRSTGWSMPVRGHAPGEVVGEGAGLAVDNVVSLPIKHGRLPLLQSVR